MNNLSWFIYFAEVIPSIGGLLIWVSIACIVGFILHAVFIKAHDYPLQGVTEGLVKPKYSLLALSFALATLASLIPSKETLYLIAGSETAEAVATSEVGQEVLNDIHEVIKAQLDNLKEKE